MIRQGKEVLVVDGKSKYTETKKRDTGEEQSQQHAHHSSNSQFLILLTFYGDYVRMCEDFAPSSGDKRTGYCITTHLLTPHFSLFPRLKIRLKGRHFDTNEVIEANLRAVLNTLTEHDFQNAF
jgi:hypothetical protein